MSGGSRTNQEHFGTRVTVSTGVGEALRLIVFDPQTSGGLLLAVDPSEVGTLLRRLSDEGVPSHEIGRVVSRDSAAPLVEIR